MLEYIVTGLGVSISFIGLVLGVIMLGVADGSWLLRSTLIIFLGIVIVLWKGVIADSIRHCLGAKKK